ncbi:MAG: histidine kinase [Ignavibacteria bacterium]|nr:histidine kinase [Ignavibacteria bacterium]
MLTAFCALLFLSHLPPTLHAMPFLLRKQLTRADGLPSNTIRHIMRDRQGIFWILTAKGICRYDGQRVYPFPLPTDKNSEKNLASLEQALTCCAEDSSGALWFGSTGGLLRFIPHSGSWKWYKQSRTEDVLLNYIQPLGLYCDTKGTLWIGTRGGFMKYDAATDSCIIPFSQFPRESAGSICENMDGTLWFGVSEKLLTAYIPRAGKLVTEVPVGCEGGYFMHRVPTDRGIWISPLTGADQTMQEPRLVTLDTVKNTFIVSAPALSLSEALKRGANIYPYANDEHDSWYARIHDYAAGRCESGLYSLMPHREQSSLPGQAEDSTLFRGLILRGDITAFFHDPRTGIVCVGNAEQGVTILIPTGIERLSDRNSIGDVICLHTDKRGRLWCGTRKGLFLRMQGAFVAVPQTPSVRPVPVYDIQETSTGTIMVATAEGLSRFDEARRVLRPLSALTASIGMTMVRNVCTDPFSKELWINVLALGILRCRDDGSVIEYFPYGQSSSSTGVPSLGTERIFSLQFDRRGDLWMGGIGVLLRWRRQTGQLERLRTLPGMVQSIVPTKFTPTKADGLMVSLSGVGMGYIHTTIPSFAEALVPHYISTASINSRLRDVQVFGAAVVDTLLWWTTITNGVYRAGYKESKSATANTLSVASPVLLLPSDENAVKYTPGDQTVAQTERGANVGSITSDGKDGVVFDYYGDVLRADRIARAYTDTARVVPIGYFRNDSVMAGLPQHGDTLHCAYNGSFALSCAVVSLARPERHRLEYHLEGVDEAWNVMPDASLRTVRYSSLQPGVYTLSIRTRAQDAYDDEALLSANMLTFRVEVPYPWWMHPITRAVGFLLLAAGFVWTGYTVQHRRTLQRVARLEREKELESVRRLASEAQMQTLRLQMNPHFLYNILAEIQLLVESGNELASYYIAVFSRLLDRVLKKAVNDFISVSDEIHILKQYIALEELRNAGRLKCYVMLTPDAAHADGTEYDDESDESDTEYWRSREMPTFILQPFVENAIRHGIRGLAEEDWKLRPDGGIITIHLFEEGDSLRCVVTDNGIGREEAARRKALRPQGAHLSIATSVTHERLQLLEKAFGVRLSIHYNDLYDETGAAAGTEVTVVMPLRAVQA